MREAGDDRRYGGRRWRARQFCELYRFN